MKHFMPLIVLISLVFMTPGLSNANNSININQWVGTWEQTKLYNKAVQKECRIDQLLKFRYVIEKGTNSELKGIIIQTDYRFNITSPPNPVCEFKNTKSKNVLLNVKKWRAKIDYDEKDNTISVTSHAGECTNDLCKSSIENDFETKVSLGDGYLIDDFGTNTNAADDIKLLGDKKRNFLLSGAKKIALQAENHFKNRNCSGLHGMIKKSHRKKVAEDYVTDCTESYKSKPGINSFSTIDQFLSFNTNENHWAIFVNKVIYQDKTEKLELMYLVYEDNVWKFWDVY